MKKSLAQTFNEIATAEHDAFPQELENLVAFLIPSSKNPIYFAPETDEQLKKNPIALNEAIEERTNYLLSNNAVGVSNANYFLGNNVVKIIALKNKNLVNTYSPSYTKEMKETADLIHEIGHLIVEYEHPELANSHLSECIANTYAALRHIQIFGNKTDFFEYYGNRAYAIIFDISSIHYTDTVTQKVKQLSKEIDISSLSLHKTAELAVKIVLENKLNDETLEKIRTAFLPVAEAFKKSGRKGYNNNDFQNCIKVILEHQDDPDIFNAVKRFFNHPNVKKRLKHNAKTDTYWKDALNFIENHQIKPLKKSFCLSIN